MNSVVGKKRQLTPEDNELLKYSIFNNKSNTMKNYIYLMITSGFAPSL